MSGFIEGVDRDQITLFPDRLEDWIDEDNLVRVVDLFVDDLDVPGRGFARSAPARTGRPGYHPAVLLKLFIYGYLNRIPSSRRLKRDGQISLSDPAARAMATSARNSGMVGCNVQCGVDTETHIIVTHEVTNKGFDRDQLSPMAIAAKEALGRDDLHALADKGYFSGAEIVACHDAGIIATLPRPETSGNRSKGMYVKADFKYDAARDVYICPTGGALTYRYTREEDGLQIARYWINECQHCPVKSHCTTGKERRITRWEYEHLVDEMRDRLRSDADPMTLRRSTVEHPFGTIKAWMGTTHFLTRRLQGVRTEMALNVLAYNIKRMVALIGIRKLLAAIPG